MSRPAPRFSLVGRPSQAVARSRRPGKAAPRLALLAVAWLLSPCSVRAEGFAVVVGVNHCPNFELPDGSRPRPLKGAEHDAEAFADVLVDQFHFPRGNVLLIRRDEATLAKLQTKMREMVKRIRVDDSFVFHFSGHGTQVADRRPFDEADGLDEALCLYDATAEGENLLLDDELGRWLDDVPAKSVTAILDCCHAGTGTKDLDGEIMPRYLPLVTATAKQSTAEEPWRDLRSATKSFGRSTAALFACHPDQQAYERRISVGDERIHAGQFSHYLLEGLHNKAADRDSDGVITNEEAATYAAHRIDETFNRRRDRSTDRQQPALESDVSNSPIFGTVKSSNSR
ncbi:MAG TPA: caspase family protein [Pirellulales bacterium]|nr:caspase family protein [Pirellulales bacterium]